MPQGSEKQCKLTPRGIQKLENALEDHFGNRPADRQVAEAFSIDRETVAKIRNGNKASTRGSIDRLFSALDLDLLEDDYEKLASTRSATIVATNPFDHTDLWGCDELLRQIFERLGKGGSQALIGPAGCGKSQILRAIVQQGSQQLNREDSTFFYIDMRLIRDEKGFFEELCTALDFEYCDQNQLRRKIIKTKRSHVLCLDTVHILLEPPFPKATPNWLRGMAEMPNSPLQLVVASRKNLQELAHDYSISSPFVDFFAGQTSILNYWSLASVEQFIQDKLIGTGVSFDQTIIYEVWKNTNGKPKEVREMVKRLYNAEIQ
ncbi:AAA family ATPase [Alkalinema pantanalense CENA528]|uniref:ATP-binding protein n=1 Tax=Alkalinema pantanalense TaxID=1620705 RepID=UPI003D6E0EC0